jgi:hypothetical protein
MLLARVAGASDVHRSNHRSTDGLLARPLV